MIGLNFLALLVFLGLGLPIAATLILSSVIGVWSDGYLPIAVLAQRVYVGLDSFPLLAVPLFILAGAIMESGGMSARIVAFGESVVGHFRGGLAQVTIFSSIIFSGVSGSQTADTAAVGSVMLPQMKERGYPVAFSTSLVAASGGMGMLVPPSIILILYGFLSNTSITALFIAGLIPAAIVCLSVMFVAYYMARKGNFPPGPAFSWPRLWMTFKRAAWALMMPVIILVGIRMGVVTVTEAAVVAVVYALLVSLFIYKDLRLRDLPKIFCDCGVLTGVIMIVVGSASIFAWYLTSQNVPAMVTDWVRGMTDSHLMILLLINLVFLVLGCSFEVTALLIMAVPIVVPLALAYGIDPVHLGIIIGANLGVGLVTPPVGVCLFVASGISKIPIEQTFRTIFPFIGAMIVALLAITYVPDICLYLPRVLLGYEG